MDNRQSECVIRLSIGFLLNVVLWLVFRRASMWGSIEREFHLNLIMGSLAMLTLVIVVPVFWKGVPWQVPIALPLIALPCIAAFSVIQVLQKY